MGAGRLAAFDTDAAATRSAFLAFPQATMQRAEAEIAEKHGDAPIWLTEFNVLYDDDFGGSASDRFIASTANTGWNALYQTGFALHAMRNPDEVASMNHHSLGNANGWGLSQPGDANAGAINATGQLFSHLTWIAAEADTMEALEPDLDPSLGVTVEGRDDLGAFESVRLSSADRDWLLVLNRGEDAADFDLKRYGLFRELSSWQYHADDAGATGYEDVSLTSGVPLWMQTGLPLTPDTATAELVPGLGLSLGVDGFSFLVVELSDALTLADLSGDGELSGDDADLFAAAYLDGLTAFCAARPDAEYWSADMSLDGVLDGGDIAGFLAALRGAGVSEARLAPVVALIPEPATAAILLAGGSLLLRRRADA